MDLIKAMKISAAGMKAQGTRLRTISENIANADSLPSAPGEKPYLRKVVTFKNELDRNLGVKLVKVDRIKSVEAGIQKRFEPTHPAADKDGYVDVPNVNSLVEMMDMREAQRSYEANLSVIEVSKSMIQGTIGLLQR
ncbi:MAG: flagellar basal body rod protein FlgC [Rhodospirillaceae bacterium]|nr:MAG: flagellar basal body rod protein FlgC [Rhodospirillaceae bacterium]